MRSIFFLLLFLVIGSCKTSSSHVQDAGIYNGKTTLYVFKDSKYQAKHHLEHPEIRVWACPEAVKISSFDELETKCPDPVWNHSVPYPYLRTLAETHPPAEQKILTEILNQGGRVNSYQLWNFNDTSDENSFVHRFFDLRTESLCRNQPKLWDLEFPRFCGLC